MRRLISIIFLAASLSGCGYFHAFRPDIAQGNMINPVHLKQLRVGMSRQQARKVMGTPVLQQVFDHHRVVYIYTLWPNHGPTKRQVVMLTFRGNRLVHIDQPHGQKSRA
jgi:outer membrane protein assembly factor BamE